MSLAYRMMYRLGVTPWEHAEPPGPLAGLIEGPDALAPGDMLDIGCGTGRDAIYCARHGWTATGVDTVARALNSARRNARQAGANVRFLQADVTRPGNSELGGYTLLLDVGCLHGLSDGALQHAAATITNAAKPGATLLMFAFAPARRGPMPSGIDPAGVPALFPQWELALSRPASEITLTGPLRNARPPWYQLVKH
jgi:SAM-dependent methyltransferase